MSSFSRFNYVFTLLDYFKYATLLMYTSGPVFGVIEPGSRPGRRAARRLQIFFNNEAISKFLTFDLRNSSTLHKQSGKFTGTQFVS